jgi:hypothetical protein
MKTLVKSLAAGEPVNAEKMLSKMTSLHLNGFEEIRGNYPTS